MGTLIVVDLHLVLAPIAGSQMHLQGVITATLAKPRYIINRLNDSITFLAIACPKHPATPIPIFNRGSSTGASKLLFVDTKLA